MRERSNKFGRQPSRINGDLNSYVENHDGPVYILNSTGLSPLQTKPSLRTYIEDLWKRRYFVVAEARSKALRSTRDFRLWQLWLVINPVLDVALYGFLFGVLFRTSRGIDNFVGFLFLGVIFMRMLTGLMTSGSGLISKSGAMIKAFDFPAAALAVSQTIRAAIDNLLPAMVGISLAYLTQLGQNITWRIIFVIPLYILMHVFGCGLMLIVARITAQIPESKAIVSVAASAWFFLSGVMFTVDRFGHVPVIASLMELNPGYIFLNAVRDCTIYAEAPSLATWALLVTWSLGTLVVGFIFFWAIEDKYVRIA